jgi:hypothetical protein
LWGNSSANHSLPPHSVQRNAASMQHILQFSYVLILYMNMHLEVDQCLELKNTLQTKGFGAVTFSVANHLWLRIEKKKYVGCKM